MINLQFIYFDFREDFYNNLHIYLTSRIKVLKN